MNKYAERRAAGLCGQCGLVPSEKCHCEGCRRKCNARARQRVADRRARGLCVDCGKQPSGQWSRCPGCAAEHNARETTGRKRRPPKSKQPRQRRYFGRKGKDPEKLSQQYGAARSRELVAKGCCPSCSQPHDGPGVLCPICTVRRRENAKRRYHKMKAAKRCVVCKQPLAPGSTVRCRKHLDENLAINNARVTGAKRGPQRPRLLRRRSEALQKLEQELLKVPKKAAEPTVSVELQDEHFLRYREIRQAREQADRERRR